jgi:uncharacterized membrane protein YgdD (TMEM256/DUF423 family)
MTQRTLIRITAVLGALSVALGAFGAHSLERLVAPDSVETFVTGVRYQFYHTLAIGLLAALWPSAQLRPGRLKTVVYLWLIGIVFFSGSLYLLSLREVHGLPVSFLGPITPIGGLLFIAGWVTLFFAVRSTDHE